MFLIKLFPEIIVKSKTVRQQQTRQLCENIRKLLQRRDIPAKVVAEWDKLFVQFRDSEACTNEQILAWQTEIAELLQDTPGISTFSLVAEHPLGELDELFQLAAQRFASQVAGKRFVVRVKRAGKHSFTSVELERKIGGALLKAAPGSSVSLKRPETTVQLEIRDQRVFLAEKRYRGLGGYPIGSQEAVLALVSGGFDSTVASYLAIKRGLKVHYCLFRLGGDEHEQKVKALSHYIWQRFGASHQVKFISVDIEPITNMMAREVHESYRGVILKRVMLKIATELALKNRCAALVTGESIAQVSSQTLTNLNVIDRAVEMLVIRPLITMNKEEIIHIAENIGAARMSEEIPEYCAAVTSKPSTRARLDRSEYEESKLPQALFSTAVSTADIQDIGRAYEHNPTVEQPAIACVTHLEVNDVIIDIRHPSEVATRPLTAFDNVIQLPYYELMEAFKRLDEKKNYLLYCQQGTLSHMQAHLLVRRGFHNVGVFAPNKSTSSN